jgi:uncharacterized membrane protein
MINIVKKYLNKNLFSDRVAAFETLFHSHPNYPSMYAITDSLELLSIENLVLKVPKEQLTGLPDSFLAFYANNFVMVSKKEDNISIETERGNQKKISYENFLSNWDGVILAIAPNETSQKPTSKTSHKTLWYALTSLSILIALSLFFYGLKSFYGLFLLNAIVGFVVSVLIILQKMDIQNTLASKICNSIGDDSCDSVIKSSKNKGNKILDFSDLPLLFFGINLMAIILFPITSAIIGLLSLLSMPIVVYTIWAQKFRLQKWCALCLMIATILVNQAVLFGFNPEITLEFSIFFYLVSFITVTTAWLLVKPLLEEKGKMQKTIINLLKLKRNYQIFDSLSKNIKVLEGFEQLEGVTFGNRDAPIKLSLILSPSCVYCHKTFQEGYQLSINYPDKVSLFILFNINPENPNNPYKKVVENILKRNRYNPLEAQNAIIDWHINKLTLEDWQKKWVIASIDPKNNQQLLLQYQWCMVNEFNYTPVTLVNKKLFPQEYDINDLKFFFNDLIKTEEGVDFMEIV